MEGKLKTTVTVPNQLTFILSNKPRARVSYSDFIMVKGVLRQKLATKGGKDV